MIRLFAAIALPEAIGEGLMRRQHGIDNARWRPQEALHITLQFFGDVREDIARDLDLEMLKVAAPSLDLTLAGAGAFGEGAKIEAVWAGVADNVALNALAKACRAAGRRVGLEPEARTYRPHVTLAYLRNANPIEAGQWIQANNLLLSPSFRVASFGLYSSHQTHEGSRYTLQASYPLG